MKLTKMYTEKLHIMLPRLITVEQDTFAWNIIKGG
jgi:hypothetical protein